MRASTLAFGRRLNATASHAREAEHYVPHLLSYHSRLAAPHAPNPEPAVQYTPPPAMGITFDYGLQGILQAAKKKVKC